MTESSFDELRTQMDVISQADGVAAAEAFAESLTEGSGAALRALMQARLFNVLGRYDRAAEIAAGLDREQPDDPAIRTVLAEARIGQGDLPRAQALLQDLAAQPAPPVEIGLLTASLAWQAGNPQAALEVLEGAHRDHPDTPGVASTLALLLADQGRAAEAIEVARQALASDPTDERALGALGTALYQQGEPEVALEPLRLAAQRTYKRAFFAVLLADCLISLERLEDALDALTAGISRLGRDPLLLERTAAVHGALGHFDEALTCALECTRGRPDWADGYARLALARIATGEHEGAREAATKAHAVGRLSNSYAEALLEAGLAPAD